MKCIYCQTKAGFFKRLCADCAKLVETVNNLPTSFGYRDLLDALLGTGVGAVKIERFLDRDLDGSGSVNDQVTARMTNEVMAGLGQPSHMSGTDVKKVREDIAAGRAPSLTDQEVVHHHDPQDPTHKH
jgi:hypothetical protein